MTLLIQGQCMFTLRRSCYCCLVKIINDYKQFSTLVLTGEIIRGLLACHFSISGHCLWLQRFTFNSEYCTAGLLVFDISTQHGKRRRINVTSDSQVIPVASPDYIMVVSMARTCLTTEGHDPAAAIGSQDLCRRCSEVGGYSPLGSNTFYCAAYGPLIDEPLYNHSSVLR